GDALLFALAPERLRAALAAGEGKAPSLKDRSGVSLGDKSSAAVYVDFERAAKFLRGFYEAELAGDKDTPWVSSSEVLEPTFAALGTAGALFGRLTGPKDQEAEGVLRVFP